jgi:hypothetical protein
MHVVHKIDEKFSYISILNTDLQIMQDSRHATLRTKIMFKQCNMFKLINNHVV